LGGWVSDLSELEVRNPIGLLAYRVLARDFRLAVESLPLSIAYSNVRRQRPRFCKPRAQGREMFSSTGLCPTPGSLPSSLDLPRQRQYSAFPLYSLVRSSQENSQGLPSSGISLPVAPSILAAGSIPLECWKHVLQRLSSRYRMICQA
jgi:hypothetical protein